MWPVAGGKMRRWSVVVGRWQNPKIPRIVESHPNAQNAFRVGHPAVPSMKPVRKSVMDEMELEAKVTVLLKHDKYSDAEDLLRNVRDEAIRNHQLDLAICALTELTRVYVLDDRLSDEERCHLEIEKLEKRAFSFVSSSWFYLYNQQNFEAAIAKADEAIAMAKTEGDTSTVYTALSAKGQARLSNYASSRRLRKF